MNKSQKNAFNSMISFMDKQYPKENAMQKTYVCGSCPDIGDKVATVKGLPIGIVTEKTLSTITILPFDHESEQYTDDVTAYRLVERAPSATCGACKHDKHAGKCSQLVGLGAGIRGVKCCPCDTRTRCDVL